MQALIFHAFLKVTFDDYRLPRTQAQSPSPKLEHRSKSDRPEFRQPIKGELLLAIELDFWMK
jgi:hypothetical protein